MARGPIEEGVAATVRPARVDLDATGVGGRGAAGEARRAPRIHQYELIREIGRGGMGAVHLARDTRLGRRVAIKFMTASSDELAQRFLVEARATAQCTHDNIVVIHEVNELAGQPFMVLEYLEGKTLRELMTGDPLPARRAVELMVPVVRALVRAHEFPLVHRDLKPENVFVTDGGTIKVLDFGVAKLSAEAGEADGDGDSAAPASPRDTGAVGTMPYMAPEQWQGSSVDHRADLWAVGIMLFELVAGRHPIVPLTREALLAAASDLDCAMPDVAEAAPHVPDELASLINRCLAKQPDDRPESAASLLAELEPHLPGRHGRSLAAHECPYPGLTPFQEDDANRFFGRSREVGRAVARLRERPLVGIVGPSGVGKSSLVRAGVIPALKATGERWDGLIVRPGRDPLAALATLVATMSSRDVADERELDVTARLLREQPGALGERLRQRADRRQTRILVFVDQFEEIYTLTSDPAERAAFTACLRGVADDVASSLRVMVSLRSDFLDRIVEDRAFLDDLTAGLVVLPAPDRSSLADALVEPIEVVGYRFEHPHIVDRMLDDLERTPGALPLLQFAATKLWDGRDRKRKILTEAAYRDMGGVAGALAVHADAVLAGLPAESQRLARHMFERLVTPERTRALVDMEELADLTEDGATARGLVDVLVSARLLTVHGGNAESEQAAVELVHDSLISTWPTLRRWLDEDADSAVFLAQLRTTAAQWHSGGRRPGMLWRGEAMEQARAWRARYQGTLAGRETAYLDAVFALADRATRNRRMAVAGTMGFLVLLLVAAAVALLWIREAEQEAVAEAERARVAENKATERERTIAAQLAAIEAEERARKAAEAQARRAEGEVSMSREELKIANQNLREALSRAEAEAQRARASEKAALSSAEAERAAKATAEEATRRARALAEEREKRIQELELSKMSTRLK